MLQLVEDYLARTRSKADAAGGARAAGPVGCGATGGRRHTPVAAGKGQRLAVAAGPVVWVRADPALLAQVTDNFVSNALKFSRPVPRCASL